MQRAASRRRMAQSDFAMDDTDREIVAHLRKNGRATNQQIAKRRILIEHVISGIKRCRIVKDTIRIWKDGVRDLVMEICCALHNLRTRSRPHPLVTSKKSV